MYKKLPTFLLNENILNKNLVSIFFFLSRATLAAYGSSWAKGGIRSVVACLHHSHSNTGSEPGLQPTPQLTAMPDPQPIE